MPEIAPFQALRYDRSHLSSMADVIAPAWAFLNDSTREKLYKRHPANIIRIAWNREEPGDETNESYQRSAYFVQSWREQGVLKADSAPGVYLIEQRHQGDASCNAQIGLLASIKLDDIIRQPITNVGPRNDLAAAESARQHFQKLVEATGLNVFPLVTVVDDEQERGWQVLKSQRAKPAMVDFQSENNLRLTVWKIDDPTVIQEVNQNWKTRLCHLLGGDSILDAMLFYRRHRQGTEGTLEEDDPAHRVLTVVCPSSADAPKVAKNKASDVTDDGAVLAIKERMLLDWPTGLLMRCVRRSTG